MKVKAGKLKECFVIVPSLSFSWVGLSSGRMYYIQLTWICWYIYLGLYKKYSDNG